MFKDEIFHLSVDENIETTCSECRIPVLPVNPMGCYLAVVAANDGHNATCRSVD